jgi:hypothetical protein
MAVKYTNILPFKGPQKYNQIGIFGLKLNHLATMEWRAVQTHNSDHLKQMLLFRVRKFSRRAVKGLP